ncbi:unnamed protein product, partial [Hapterophycus canaliculatus]
MSSAASPAEGAGGHGVAGDSIVLEEEIDQNYVPSEDEVREYAKWLGMELGDDLDLFWIAKEGLKAPLPENWKPCKTVDTEEIYYFNFATGESTWDHPCDEYYRKLYEEEKKKKMTKDKAKHDKSKQQARKDVSQLLGKEKKRKNKPSGKRPARQSSPELVQTVLSSASSIFDRKPLPDIGRQPSRDGHSSVHQVASPPQSDKAAALGDGSPSRTHASSLVGHRLSQHLSVSVGSEKGDRKGGDGSAKSSPRGAPLRSREEAYAYLSKTATIGLQSEHDDVLKDLREKHARDLDALKQAHSDTKQQLEVDHRQSMTTQQRQWAASAEAEAEKARRELKRELQEMRTNHSREIDKLECTMLDAKARADKTLAETEEANEAARTEKVTLKSTLAELERRVTTEKNYLQEAQEAALKVQGTEDSQAGVDLQRELALVAVELEDERKRVTDLERRLKEASNGIMEPPLQFGDDSNQAEERKCQDQDRVSSKVNLLEDELAQTIRENESLRKDVERAAACGDVSQLDDGRTCTCGRRTKTLEDAEVVHLNKALQDAQSRLSELQQAQARSIKDANYAAAALVTLEVKSAGVELDNRRLVERVSNMNEIARMEDETNGEGVSIADAKLAHKVSDAQEGHGTMDSQTALQKREADASAKARETEELRANLEAARNDLACCASEAHKSMEQENVVRNEFHAVQMALRESQLKIDELSGIIATADHEKKIACATAEGLRLENERLKCIKEVASPAPEGETSRDFSDPSVNELKELRGQLAAMKLERECLIDEVGALKRQLVSSEGVQKAERGVSDSSLAGQQSQVESLQTVVQRLEGEVSAGQRKEEALHATAKDLRESLAASKLETWRLQVQCCQLTSHAESVTTNLVYVQQEVVQKCGQNGDYEAVTVPVADYDKATAEAREIASRLKLAEEEVEHLKGSLAEMKAKLVDSEGLVVSLKLSSERAQSLLGSEKKATTQRLEKALARCAQAEDSLAQARGDRASFEDALRGAGLTVKPFCDLEQTLLRSQEKSEVAREDLACSKQRVEDLQQQCANLQQHLAESNAEAEAAMQQARHNSELACTRKEEIVRITEREQTSRTDLLRARSRLEDAEEARRSALAAADETKRHFADSENGWRHEADTLRETLKEALATVNSKNEEKTQPSEQREAPPQSPQTSEGRRSLPETPRVCATGNPGVANEGPQLSTSGASDAASRELAEELMRKLNNEVNQRRHTKLRLCDEASRSWAKKLKEERSMLALAKEAVRHHKERVKKRQQRLFLCQTRWRNQRHEYESSPQKKTRRHHSARQRSLEDAKRELDSEVYKLNRFVKQLRSSKCWLDQREMKIADFEALLGGEEDASDLDSRAENQTSRTASSGTPTSLEAMEEVSVRQCSNGFNSENLPTFLRPCLSFQEVDNDFSKFAASGSIGGLRRSHSIRGGKKPAQRYSSKQGKENVFPGPWHPMEDPPGSPFPAELGFWRYPSHPSPGEDPRYKDGIRSRSRASCPPQKIHLQEPARSGGVQGALDGLLDWSSDAEIQRWLNRSELDLRREIRGGVAARERREHLTKLTVESRQAQSAVALHVDWLNKLREEMGLLGLHNSNPS